MGDRLIFVVVDRLDFEGLLCCVFPEFLIKLALKTNGN